MVEYYFDDIEKQKQLKSILGEWEGTPYKHHVGVKGMGCDCIHFVAGVFRDLGVLPKDFNRLPAYPRDWHFHNTRELLLDTIPKYLKGVKLDISERLNNGDIILSHYGKAASHAGIYFDGYVHQSIDAVGVRKINFNDSKMKNQMKYIFRVIK